MENRGVLNGVLSAALAGFVDTLGIMCWLLIFAVVLIFVDLRFGIKAARKRKERIRFSRAIRRSINKMVDYLCWLCIAAVIDQAFGHALNIPILPNIVMGIIFIVELNSCFSNYFFSIGKKININLFKWFKKKTDIDIDIQEEDNFKNKSL